MFSFIPELVFLLLNMLFSFVKYFHNFPSLMPFRDTSHMSVLFPFTLRIATKPSRNSNTVSVHFNHLYCTEICDKLRRDLAMLTYIYLDVDECWLMSSMPYKGFNSTFLSIMLILNNMCFWCVVGGHVSFNLVRLHITLLLPYSINNDRHSPACITG